MLELKLGVAKGESLEDDMEGCGDELVLRRACAPGGGWPSERVEIIRPSDEGTLRANSCLKYALDDQAVLRAGSTQRRDVPSERV